MVLGMHSHLSSRSTGLLRGGFLGVDAFFVLSGFLITTLLLDEHARAGRIRLNRFYARRALRLLPALIVFVLLSVLFALTYASERQAAAIWSAVVPALFYYLNWGVIWGVVLSDFPDQIFAHTWSLAIEEQFYLVWPPFLSILLRLHIPRPGILVLVCGGIGASATLRALVYSRDPSFWARPFAGTDTRADAILMGCLLGLLMSWRMLPESPRFRTVIRGAALASAGFFVYLLGSVTSGSPFLYRGGFTLVALAVAVVILEVFNPGPSLFAGTLELPPLVWLGRLSYGVYLWHFPIFILLAPSLGVRDPSVGVLVSAVGTFAVATVAFYALEQPFLRLKDRFKAA
jgi:peptidoglycan/LPS O-acetylase OafA/YrhL